MIFIRQAVWIDKMCIICANFCSLFIHHFDKCRHTAGNMLGYRNGCIIAGMHHHPGQKFPQRNLIPLYQPKGGAFHTFGMLAHRHDIVQPAMLQRHNQRHHLRGAGRIAARINIPFIKNLPRHGIHYDGRTRGKLLQRVCGTDHQSRNIRPFRLYINLILHLGRHRRHLRKIYHQTGSPQQQSCGCFTGDCSSQQHTLHLLT